MQTSQRSHEFMGYQWSSSDFLGRGATCRVYKGTKISDGTPVAIKVYNQDQSDFDRGHEFLKHFDHDCIIKFYCEGHYPVLKCVVSIMELCSQGDLQTMLNSPKNCNGLNDKDFLLLLDCLYKSKKVLQLENVVHRDIKPLNICYHVDEVGRRFFKLIDFGFARTLADGELAKTFAGTPEFCHPHLYRRYINRHTNQKMKGESVYLDLWSSGVTFYHAATSKLPFRPLDQQNDPTIWLLMTLNKPRGAIASAQKKVRATFDYYYRLPRDIQLSESLAKLMVPMLSRLLESDENDVWNFAEYFRKCEDILSRRCVRLFAPVDGRVQKAYLHQVTNKTLQNEFKYLWRTPDEDEEMKPFPEESDDTDNDPNIAIFHNGHKLAKNETIDFNSNLPRFNQKNEIFIVVQMDPAVWETDANVKLGPGKRVITLGKEMKCDPVPLNEATLKTSIANLTKCLWQYSREIKAFRLAFQLYPVAVDSLCNKLAIRFQKVLSDIPFHKSLTNNNVKEIETKAEEYLQQKVGYSTWTDLVKGISNMPSNDLNISSIPRKGEEILNERPINSSHLARVRKLVQAISPRYTDEKLYFEKMREAFYRWMREIYFPNIKILDEFEKQHADLLTQVQSSAPNSHSSEMNMSIVRKEIEQVMKKAASFQESLNTLKKLMPPE